jgi:hypothetical protein
VWSVEKSCMLVGKLLKTHTRLVYSNAPLLTQVHLSLLQSTHSLVKLHEHLFSKDVHIKHSLTTATTTTTTTATAVLLNNKGLILELVSRMARSSSRIIADCCHEKHISTLRRHLPPIFLELVNILGSWNMSQNEAARVAKKDLLNGYLSAVGVLGPKDTQHITTLLGGGPHDTPRAVFKELLEEHAKVNKFTGRY